MASIKSDKSFRGDSRGQSAPDAGDNSCFIETVVVTSSKR